MKKIIYLILLLPFCIDGLAQSMVPKPPKLNLDSYILLGYDFSGKHLDIKAASTPQQKEALNSFLMKYFASEIQSIKGTDELL